MEEAQIKARELIIKFQFRNPPMMFEDAKSCALICVDEIIDLDSGDSIDTDWWLEVKQHLTEM